MQTLRSMADVARRTAVGWWRALPTLLVIAAGGTALYLAGLHLTVALGKGQQLLGTIVFVVGCLGLLVAQLWQLDALRSPAARTGEGRIALARRCLGPALGIAAAWGLVDHWYQQLLQVNVARTERFVRREDWSVSLDTSQLWFYALLWVGALVVRRLLARLDPAARRTGLLQLLVEGLVAWGGFMTLLVGARALAERAGGLALLRNAWRVEDAVLGWLPDWRVFGMLLPDAVKAGLGWFFGTAVPAAWQGLLLPAVGIALTALVLGGDHIASDDVRALGGTSLRSRVVRLLTGDLRTKYVPLLRGLRLVARPGLAVLAAYLLLGIAVDLLNAYLVPGLNRALGATTTQATVRWWPLVTLVSHVVCDPLRSSLQVAVTERALRADAAAGRPAEAPATASGQPVDLAVEPQLQHPAGGVGLGHLEGEPGLA